MEILEFILKNEFIFFIYILVLVIIISVKVKIAKIKNINKQNDMENLINTIVSQAEDNPEMSESFISFAIVNEAKRIKEKYK